MGDLDLGAMKPLAVHRWFLTLSLAQKTKAHIKSVIRQVFEYAMLCEKTKKSKARLPLEPVLIAVLENWRTISEFKADSDWVWASPWVAGAMPYYLNAGSAITSSRLASVQAWANPWAGIPAGTRIAPGWTRAVRRSGYSRI